MYGQICWEGELRAASTIARKLEIEHSVVWADVSALGSGDLANRPPSELAPASEWWPYRNQHLLTVASMWALGKGVDRLLFGSVKSDAFHADGRKSFFDTFNLLLKTQEGQVEVEAPALEYTTKEYIDQFSVPIRILGWSHSCHVGEFACGNCRGCFKRMEVLASLAS